MGWSYRELEECPYDLIAIITEMIEETAGDV